jgi:hypothetical protein
MKIIIGGVNLKDKQIILLYNYYVQQYWRLNKIYNRTKNRRIRSKLFDRMIKLKDKYDWTYDQIYRRKLLQFKSI